MGSRTRRLVFLRLMAVVAICFMAIGHLLYSMTVGLDGYARMHMAVIAPSATSHKDLQDLMSNPGGELSNHRRMRQGRRRKGQAATGHLAGCSRAHAGETCKLKFEGIEQRASNSNKKVHGTYSIKPVADMPWDMQKLSFKDISALSAHVKAHNNNNNNNNNNNSLVHVRHCPYLRLQASLVEASRVSDASPWQPTSHGRQSYVFSAYHDGRSHRSGHPATHRSVKVVGARATQGGPVPAFCQLWYADEDVSEEDVDEGMLGVSRSPLVVPLTAYPLSDPADSSRFAAFLYVCDLPTRRPPLGVSLVPEACSPPTNYLPVGGRQGTGEKAEVSVCVRPLEARYDDTDGLLQMVEVNRMFGADRFLFYNQSTGRDVGDHLKNYVADNLASVIAFSPPSLHPSAASEEERNAAADWEKAALSVAQNDCLYRNMFSSKYLAFLHVNEVLVPRGYRKWDDMLSDVSASHMRARATSMTSPISSLSSSAAAMAAMGAAMPTAASTSTVAAYFFRTATFRSDWPDDIKYATNDWVRQLQLTTLLKTEREVVDPQLNPAASGPGQLRYVVRPLQISMLSVGGPVPVAGAGVTGLPVPQTKALVHLYDSATKNKMQRPQARRHRVRDTVLLPYYDVILARILERRERLENTMT